MIAVMVVGNLPPACSLTYFTSPPFVSQDPTRSTQQTDLMVAAYRVGVGLSQVATDRAASRYGRQPTLVVSVYAYVSVSSGLTLQGPIAVPFVLRMLQRQATSVGFVHRPSLEGYIHAQDMISDMLMPSESGVHSGFLAPLHAVLPSTGQLVLV